MLTRDQATTMLELQASMNAKVDPDWVAARYPYLRAVAIEGAEAIEHHGWKWWKKQDKDLPQLQMELIDIWHFILSEVLLRNENEPEEPLKALLDALQAAEHSDRIEVDGQQFELAELDLLRKLELLIALSVLRRIDMALFAAIMADCDMDWTELYRQYVGKNVLNMFRQDRGYKQGTYLKEWHGREDNEHLVEVIHRLDADAPDFKDRIYSALSEAYPD
ncbi:MAG: dUTP diphosphatase [Pseudomonadales bacterium]|nr:dUTP diphosphatase [Pseudomonadales bacterium]